MNSDTSGKTVSQRVDVDGEQCDLFGVCMHEAPAVFQIGDDGRLHYPKRPESEHGPAVRQAARMCPKQAIRVKES